MPGSAPNRRENASAGAGSSSQCCLRDPPRSRFARRGRGGELAPPRTAAVLACSESELDELARRLPPDTLAAPLKASDAW